MLNKKILAAAVLGCLFAGSATAASLTVTKQYYAQEIVIPAAGLVPTAAPALTWNSGYNYSAGEVKYVRIELTGAKFLNSLPTPTVTNGNVGAINGLGTNVITFSVTAGATPIVASNPFTLNLSSALPAPTGHINIPTKGNVSVKVSLYDQASQAQAGGATGLLAVGSYDDTVFLTFTKSYELSNVNNTLVADVASTPGVAYNDFVADGSTGPATTTGAGTLNDDLSVKLIDPDGSTGPTAGPQTATFKADGNPITLADLFGATSKLEVEGNFSAATAVTLNAVAPTPAFAATATKLTWAGVPNGNVASLVFTNGALAIPVSNYKATFTPVAASTAYEVTALTAATAGDIKRNGLELQAPLAQVPGDWISRLVLTNTGSDSPKYTIVVLGESGNTITTDATKLTGTVKPGTNVIDLNTVMTGFTGAPRGTMVVTVEAPDNTTGYGSGGTIQGLYQIVNPEKGSISNHVMVRPGSN